MSEVWLALACLQLYIEYIRSEIPSVKSDLERGGLFKMVCLSIYGQRNQRTETSQSSNLRSAQGDTDNKLFTSSANRRLTYFIFLEN